MDGYNLLSLQPHMKILRLFGRLTSASSLRRVYGETRAWRMGATAKATSSGGASKSRLGG